MHGFFLNNTKVKKIAYIAILLLNCQFIFAQNFDAQIKELNALGKAIISSTTNEEKHVANSKFESTLKELLSNNASFEYSFDSLKSISILKAHQLKIYNWTIPLQDGSFEYFAFLQFKNSKNEIHIQQLIDKSESIKTPESKTLTAKNWYGALYYKIIYNKKIGSNTYTLLGWDGNNKLTNKKIIESVSIADNGIIKFGLPIFKTKKKVKRRVIFEYSENAVMSVKYHPEMEKIIFDFLVPSSSKLKGVWEYYGPALNRFDAFNLDKGKWLYEEDTKIELDRNIKDNMWVDPTK